MSARNPVNRILAPHFGRSLAVACVSLLCSAGVALALDVSNHPGVPFLKYVTYQDTVAPMNAVGVFYDDNAVTMQGVHCASPTDSQAYLDGYFNTPDSVKFGKKSAKGSQKTWVTILVAVGDGAGGTTATLGPLPASGCSVSWSLKDDNEDLFYNGGTDVISGKLSCDAESLVALGLTDTQVQDLTSQLGGKLSCTVTGVPTDTGVM